MLQASKSFDVIPPLYSPCLQRSEIVQMIPQMFFLFHIQQWQGQKSSASSAWSGILIFGSDFWDPHKKQNSDFVFDSKDSGWKIFLEFCC
jgi:hypothetical protein